MPLKGEGSDGDQPDADGEHGPARVQPRRRLACTGIYLTPVGEVETAADGWRQPAWSVSGHTAVSGEYGPVTVLGSTKPEPAAQLN